MNIGIIGNGFVGEAIRENLKEHYTVLAYDINPKLSDCENISYITERCSYIFVAVPTPMHLDGHPDLSCVLGVMEDINQSYNNNIIILKSTVVPGTCREIKKRYPSLRIVFSPEFLTEANSIKDFGTCNRVIYGGDSIDTEKCVAMMKGAFPAKEYRITDWETAEMVKYYINTFLAAKVSFANEMKQICSIAGIEYNTVKDLVLLDNRIGKSHFMVPGPDGYHGFGGKCFAKDLNALMHYCILNNVKPTMLQAAWQKNLEVREEKDWLNIKGAVTKENKK
jgi:nucleotide sugar dehydrogenase